ncbi:MULTISPECIES: hypothetical protein [Haloferax]|uniref:Uncharacterized protein n=1 Tax=Haloferax marinum TaxID=2666143 RepID=A0A6A8GB01_9EURY|nr:MULTISPECIES: hypothetical protein [Haloferax]KAB1190728.1 hypothetical protein Hfx1150_16990 [Haloferax sp. CBA1150]MRW98264.1 hypothetical protein [Haloferax marinum]
MNTLLVGGCGFTGTAEVDGAQDLGRLTSTTAIGRREQSWAACVDATSVATFVLTSLTTEALR